MFFEKSCSKNICSKKLQDNNLKKVDESIKSQSKLKEISLEKTIRKNCSLINENMTGIMSQLDDEDSYKSCN